MNKYLIYLIYICVLEQRIKVLKVEGESREI